jgi:hypothetical protein
MSAATLASAVVRIGIDQSAWLAGLAGVKSDLTGFVGYSQLLGGRIAGGLIGAAGQKVLASKAETALGPSRANVEREQGNVKAARAGLTQANVGLSNARFALQHANTAASRAAAQTALYAAQVNVQVARAGVTRTTGNLAQAQAAAKAAATAFEGTAAGIGRIATAASAAVGVVVALAHGLVSLASAGAEMNRIGRNLDQTFGSWGAGVRAAAETQASSIGRSKAEFLDYATAVGRQLETLGVKAGVAAELATRQAEAVSRLAQSRGIGFGEAAQAVRSTVTEDEVKGYAAQKGYLTSLSSVLDEAVAAMLRYELETEKANELAADGAGATATWSNQLTAIQETFGNLASTIGTDLQPIFVKFFEAVNAYLQQAIILWGQFRDLLVSLGILSAPEIPDLAATDDRNEASIQRTRERRTAGAAFRGGGGGGRGGFQGDLAGFWKRTQESAFNQNTAAQRQKQIALAEKQVALTEELVRLGKQGKLNTVIPGNPQAWK